MVTKSFLRTLVIAGIVAVSSLSFGQQMATDDSTFIKIRLVRAKEIKAASITTVSMVEGVPTLSSGTYHVLAYTYRHMTGNDLSGDASIGGGTSGGGGIEPAEESLLEGETETGGVGGTGGGGTGGGGGSNNESYYLSIPGVTVNGSLQGILVESGVTPGAYMYTPLAPGILNLHNYLFEQGYPEPDKETSVAGIRVKLNPGQEVTVCYYKPSSWKLTSGDGQVMVTEVRHQAQPPTYVTWQTGLAQQEVYYTLSRQDVSGDTAVDSRKGYGQPNREGQFPADPNAELRNLNFGDWLFKGGMFVGNMPSSSKDMSGTARFQLFDALAFSPQDQISIPRMTVATVYQAGKPTDSSITGAMTIGIFAPLDTTTTGTTESNSTWATKWNITPRATIPTSGSYEQNKDPWRKFVIGDTDGADLLSVGMTKVYDAPHTSGGFTVYKTTWSTPKFEGLCYALHDEQNLVDASFMGWRYFADKEFTVVNYDLLPSSFRDIAPRYWRFFISESYSAGSAYQFDFDWHWNGWI